MPAYVVTAIEGRFAAEQKSRLAMAITDIHCKVTGAPRFLVQVIFSEVAVGNYFIGGTSLKFDNILVHGQIEGRRRGETKKQIIAELLHAAALISETDRSAIQIFIADVPAGQIAEWGKISPPVGNEAAWEGALPNDVKGRARIVDAKVPTPRRR